MTTLVGIQGAGFAVIAAESQISSDGLKSSSISGKICHSGPTIIAAAGNLRGINLLQHAWIAPAFGRYKSTDAYITRSFIPKMREMFIKNGYDMKDLDVVASSGSAMLVAIKSVIYAIDSDYSWDRVKSGLYAVGSGAEIALGVMWTLGGHSKPNRNEATAVCKKAIEGAKYFDSSSGFEIQTVVQLDR